MGTFKLLCTNCNTKLTADDAWIGMETNCPKCNAPITIRKPLETPSPAAPVPVVPIMMPNQSPPLQQQSPTPVLAAPPMGIPVSQVIIQNGGNAAPKDGVMTMGSWLGAMLVMAVPILNIIIMIVWACDNRRPSRANFFRAYFIMMAAWLVLAIVGWAVFAMAYANAFSSY